MKFEILGASMGVKQQLIRLLGIDTYDFMGMAVDFLFI